MNVRVKFLGFPLLKRLFGEGEIEVALDGDTLGDLIRHLEKQRGAAVGRELLGQSGAVAEFVQIIVNDRTWLERDDMAQTLHEGDRITFLLMLAGG